jgi:hypothetical protein
MKFSLVAIAAVIGSAQAFRKVTFSVSDGSFSTINEALDPTLTLTGDTENGDVRLDYGLEVEPTADIASLPKKGFVNLLYTKGDDLLVDVKANKDMRSGETKVVAGVLNAEKIHGVIAEASASGGNLELDSVTGITELPIEEGSLKVTGTYVPDGDPTVLLAFKHGNGNTDIDVKVTGGAAAFDTEATLTHRIMDNTGITVAYNEDTSIVFEHKRDDDLDITVTASASDQKVTLSKTFGDDTISPTITKSGVTSVAWERDLGDDNSFTATVVPDDSINVEWKDDNWTANINAGLSGIEIGDLSVSAKRDINF